MIDLKAEFGRCEEAVIGFTFYAPCNHPAVAVVGWRGRSDPAIRMCAMCLDHNVKNRGGEVIRYVANWDAEEPSRS
jgi:hypothetical protein